MGGRAKTSQRMLPDSFQAAIDAYAMKDGSTDMDAYLEGCTAGRCWSATERRKR